VADWLPLAYVAMRPLPGRGVATAPHALDHAAFLHQVAGWRRAFAAQPGPDWVLYFDDAVRFAAALFGAWHAGKRVFLCGDNLPQTLTRLQAQVDGFAGVAAACRC
jgi:acyl-CoA synthetase (AMP-forming)/AMP-acid ligase II